MADTRLRGVRPNFSMTAPKLFVAALFLFTCFYLSGYLAHMPSERVYLTWPVAVFLGWSLGRMPGQRMTEKGRFRLGLLAVGFGGLIYYDIWGPEGTLRRGELVRVAYCLLGILLLMGMVRTGILRCLSPRIRERAKHSTSIRIAGRVLWLLLFAAILYPYLLSYMQIHPLKRRVSPEQQAEFKSVCQDVAWDSRDGTTLRGWFIPAENSDRTAIICHGVMDTRVGMMDFVRALHGAGYNCLLFDMRGHGQSDGWTATFGRREKDDVIAGVDFLKQHKPEASRHVVGVGWSMGAASLILAAAEDNRIEALHLDAPYARTSDMARNIMSKLPTYLQWWSYHAGVAIGSLETSVNLFAFSTIEAVARISPRPIMIVHGDRDSVIPIRQGELVYAAGGEPKSFHVVLHADHCQTLTVEHPAYANRMIQFLNQSLNAARPVR